MHKRFMVPFLVTTALACAASFPAQAQRWDTKVDLTGAVTVGQARSMWSTTLGEERRLFIYLPRHYQRSGKSYPVLYLLDAEWQFTQAASVLQFLGAMNERIPDMILIGLVNVDRGRDFPPPTTDPEWRDKFPGLGADRFLKFLADELAPWVDAHYRTVPYRVLVGHSFGGLFNTHAMINRPEVFQAHIAISPSLWWDKAAVVGKTDAGIRRLHNPPWLFLSWGDGEPTIRDSTQKLVELLSAEPPPGLRLEHRYYAGDDHMSTPHRSLYDALELLFKGWRMAAPQDESEAGPTSSEVEAHYAALSKRFGFSIAPSAAALDRVAQGLLKRSENAAALEVLRRNVWEYPYLADTHQALAAALEKLDRKEEALLAYQQALRVAVDDDNPYGDPVGEYRAKVKELAGER